MDFKLIQFIFQIILFLLISRWAFELGRKAERKEAFKLEEKIQKSVSKFNFLPEEKRQDEKEEAKNFQENSIEETYKEQEERIKKELKARRELIKSAQEDKSSELSAYKLKFGEKR